MSAHGSIPVLQIGSTLLASIHVELRDTIADAFQEDILQTIATERASPRRSGLGARQELRRHERL